MTFDIKAFIKELKNMKLSEINQLVKAIEEEFGVKAQAMVAAQSTEESQESSEKTVELISAGTNKIAVIKLLKEILGLGLMEAKKFSEQGGVVKEKISPEEAKELAGKFQEIGAEVKVK